MAIDPLYWFLFAGMFSPGPNVIMLTASGARFGFAATVPHLLGVVIGVGLIGAATALGIGGMLLAVPELTFVLKLAAAGWILWLARGVWRAGDAPAEARDDRPFRFAEALLFQAINPKIWAIAFAAVSGFGGVASPLDEAAHFGTRFSGVNLFVCLFWTATGHGLRRLLASPAAWRVFMRVMAVALAASAVLVFV